MLQLFFLRTITWHLQRHLFCGQDLTVSLSSAIYERCDISRSLDLAQLPFLSLNSEDRSLLDKYPTFRRISVMFVNNDHRCIGLKRTLQTDKVNHFIFTDKISEFKLVRKPGQEFRLLNYQISTSLLFYRICPHSCGYKIRSHMKSVIQLKKKYFPQNRH